MFACSCLLLLPLSLCLAGCPVFVVEDLCFLVCLRESRGMCLWTVCVIYLCSQVDTLRCTLSGTGDVVGDACVIRTRFDFFPVYSTYVLMVW